MSVAHHGVLSTHTLAHHLDTALAACDELLTRNADTGSALRLELTVITHVLQARQSAAEMRVQDSELMQWCAFFLSETDVLEASVPCQSGSKHRAGELLIGGRIGISGLTAMLASLLDALDRRSVSDEDESEREPAPKSLQSQEALVWANGADAA